MSLPIEDLSGILSRESRMKTLQNNGPEELLNQGAFADAKKRQSAWMSKPSLPDEPTPEDDMAVKPFLLAQLPIGIGGGGNTSAMSQLKTLATEEKTNAPLPTTASKLPTLQTMPQGQAKTPEQLDAIRADQARVEQKLFGKKAAPANETEDQKNRRLHPELY